MENAMRRNARKGGKRAERAKDRSFCDPEDKGHWPASRWNMEIEGVWNRAMTGDQGGVDRGKIPL